MSVTFHAGRALQGPNFNNGNASIVLEYLELPSRHGCLCGEAPISLVRERMVPALNRIKADPRPTVVEGRFFQTGLTAEGLRERLVTLFDFLAVAEAHGQSILEWG